MLEGKIAVVTGGAQGIGRHAAKTLAAAGARVAIADMNTETAEATAAALGGPAVHNRPRPDSHCHPGSRFARNL